MGQNISLTTNVSKVSNGGTVNNADPTVQSVSNDLQPSFEDVAPVAGLDCPSIVEHPLVGERVYSGYNSSVDSPQMLEMMDLIQHNFVPTVNEHFGVWDDEMNLQNLVGRFVRFQNISWTPTDQPGTVLLANHMSPFPNAPLYNTKEIQTMSPMEYMALINSFWTGDLELRVEIVASKFHSGRLFLGLHYGEYSIPTVTTWTLRQLTGQYGQFIDIREGCVNHSITMNYKASTPWLNSYSGVLDAVAWSMGAFSISVVNALVAPATASPSIDINVYIAAGPNFQVHYPRALTNLKANLNSPWVPLPESEPTAINGNGVSYSLYGDSSFTSSKQIHLDKTRSGLLLDVTDFLAVDDSKVDLITSTSYKFSGSGNYVILVSAAVQTPGTQPVSNAFVFNNIVENYTQNSGNISGSGSSSQFRFSSIDVTDQNFSSAIMQIGAALPNAVGLTNSVLVSTIKHDPVGTKDFVFHHCMIVKLLGSGNWFLVSSHSDTLASNSNGYQFTGPAPIPSRSYPGTPTFTSAGSPPLILNLPTVAQDIKAAYVNIHVPRLAGIAIDVPMVTSFNVEYDTGSGTVPFANISHNPDSLGGEVNIVAWDETLPGIVGVVVTLNFTADVKNEFTDADWITVTMVGSTDTTTLQSEEELVPENVDVHAVNLDSDLIGHGRVASLEDKHFSESFSDLRFGLRRFVEVTPLSLQSEAPAKIAISELLQQHPFFRLYANMFRYCRGNIRIRFFMENHQLVDVVKIRVASTPYDLITSSDVDLFTGLATKLFSGVVPSATIEIPYLSTLHCLYTPYAVPSSGSSYSQELLVKSSANLTLRVFVALGDNFRLGAFTGLGSVLLVPGAPNFLDVDNDFGPTLFEIVKLQSEDEEFSYGGVSYSEGRMVQHPMFPVVDSSSRAVMHMPEDNWSIAQLLQRPGYVGQITWTTTQDVGAMVTSFQVPFDLLASDISRLPLTNFRFLRFSKLVVRFQVNGMPMHSGRLAAFYQPGVTDADYIARYPDPSFITSLKHHVMLNPAEATVADLEIPFNHPLGYLHVDSQPASEEFTRFLGQLRVVVFNQLKVGPGGDQQVNVNVTAKFVNLQAKVPLVNSLLTR